VFDYPSRLKQHLAKKTPCDVLREGGHRCDGCGKHFANRVSFGHHQRHTCAAIVHAPQVPGGPPPPHRERGGDGAPPPAPGPGPPPPPPPPPPTTVVHNHFEGVCNFTVEGGGVVAGAGASVVAAGAGATVAVGVGAPAPPAPPAPRPPAAAARVLPASAPHPVTLASFRSALDAIGPAMAAGCREARPEGAAHLLTRLMCQAQAAREERRSLRRCRERGDLVEICAGGAGAGAEAEAEAEAEWQRAPLLRALEVLFDQLALGLDQVLEGTPSEQGAAEGAQRTYTENPRAVLRATPRDEIAAHLENLGRPGAGALPPARGAGEPRPFGEGAISRVDFGGLGNEALRLAAGGGDSDARVSRAILAGAVREAFRDERNAALFEAGGGYVAWTAHGWRPWAPAAAARALFGQCVIVLEVALRRVLVPGGGAGGGAGGAHLVADEEGGGVLAVREAGGGLVAAGTGGAVAAAALDPALARVHPHPESACTATPTTRLLRETAAEISRGTAMGDVAEATRYVRQRALVLVARAGELLGADDWTGLLGEASRACLRHAAASGAPCYEALRDRWLAPRTAADVPPPALGGGARPPPAPPAPPPPRTRPPEGFYD
jgi:hypothetical protein